MDTQSAQQPSSPNPSTAEILSARTAAGLTQTGAAELVHTKCRVWQHWEAGDRQMHPAFWELFRIKCAELVKPKAAIRAAIDIL